MRFESIRSVLSLIWEILQEFVQRLVGQSVLCPAVGPIEPLSAQLGVEEEFVAASAKVGVDALPGRRVEKALGAVLQEEMVAVEEPIAPGHGKQLVLIASAVDPVGSVLHVGIPVRGRVQTASVPFYQIQIFYFFLFMAKSGSNKPVIY